MVLSDVFIDVCGDPFIQIRISATGILMESKRKGSALDDERLKSFGGGYFYLFL